MILFVRLEKAFCFRLYWQRASGAIFFGSQARAPLDFRPPNIPSDGSLQIHRCLLSKGCGRRWVVQIDRVLRRPLVLCWLGQKAFDVPLLGPEEAAAPLSCELGVPCVLLPPRPTRPIP